MERLVARGIGILMQQLCLSLLQGSGVFDLREVHFRVVLFLRDVFEDQRMATNVDVCLHNLPYMRAELTAFDVKCAPGFQIPEQAKADLDVVDKPTLETGDAMLLAVDCHIAFHGSKNAGLEIWRPKLRIGPEMEQDLTSRLTCNGPDEGIGEHLQEFGCLIVIVLAAFALLGLRGRVIHKGAHLVALYILRKCLPISLDHAIEARGTRFCDPLFHGFAGASIDFEIEPVGVVVAAGGEFSLNGLNDNLARRLRETRQSCGHKGYECE